MTNSRRTPRLFAWMARRRLPVAMICLFLVCSPAFPSDDRQLLQTSAGSNVDILLILDSSASMNTEFTDPPTNTLAGYELPAYMDDFLYPQGTVSNVQGSKLGLAKSVLRQVLAEAQGVNWAFAYYRNPLQNFGVEFDADFNRIPGAVNPGDKLPNGGVEWLYFADKIDSTSPNSAGDDIINVFPCTTVPILNCSYPDIQQGRFLQLGHKVMHNYARVDTGFVADVRFPYPSAPGVPPPGQPQPGTWRGAFGPKGLNQGVVVYRNPNAPGKELRLQMVSGNYGDPKVVIQVQEFGAPPPRPRRLRRERRRTRRRLRRRPRRR